MRDTVHLAGSSKKLLGLIVILLAGYVAASIYGLPQRGTEMIVAQGLDCLLYTSPSPRDS